MTIEARELTKFYGEVIGLNRVSASVGPGVTGLLGPNGAGKTTFLRLLSGQLRPSAGSLTVLGESPWNNRRVLSRLGYCPDEDAFYGFLTAREFVTALARLSGVPWREAPGRAAATLERVGLGPHLDRSLAGFSRGMRQRVKFAQAIVHDPDVLLLDEPLTGADPVGRRDLRDLIAEQAAAGKLVLVSTHVLHEVEALTRQVLLIHHGQVVASGDVGEIRALIDDHPHRVVIRCRRPRAAAQALLAREDVRGASLRDDGALVVETREPAALFAALPALLLEVGAGVEELYSEDDHLEAVFRYLVQG